MLKKSRERNISSCRDDDEYVKAAAWAWYEHGAGATSKLIREYDVQNRQNPTTTTTIPSRFKLEAARLAHLNTISQSLNTVSKKARSVDGLYKNIVGSCQMLEFHENEDVGDSSLLDHYEIVELKRSLEKSLSISVKKSAVPSDASWIERGLSGGLVHTPTVDVGYNNHKKKDFKASKPAVVKHWWTPAVVDVGDNNHKKKDFKTSKSRVVKHWWTAAMCSMTDVVIPGMAEIGSPKRSPRHSKKNGDWKLSKRSHGVRHRLWPALVVSPCSSPSHGNNDIQASSSASRNSWDCSHKRQTFDHG